MADGEYAFVTVPMLGHLMPMLPFMEALLQRGRKVVVFHPSEAKYRGTLEQFGLAGCESVLYDPAWKLSPLDAPEAMYSALDQRYGGSADGARRRASVIVFDFFARDAADFAELQRIPSVCVFPNPQSINPWAAALPIQGSWRWALWGALCTSLLEPALARLLWWKAGLITRRRRGLPWAQWEQDMYPSPFGTQRIINTASPLFEFPSRASPATSMVGPSVCRAFPPAEPGMEAWMRREGAARKLVYVAFGTMLKYTPAGAAALAGALAELGVAVMWSLPAEYHPSVQEGLGGTIPPHWRVESFVPQVAVLKSGAVAVFVTHGGANSVNEGLLAGVPMVVEPGFADQPANGVRVERAGVGIIANPGFRTPGGGLRPGKAPGIAAALQRVLRDHSTYALRAEGLKNRLAEHNAASTAASIIEAAAQGAVTPTTAQSRWPLAVFACAAMVVYVAWQWVR